MQFGARRLRRFIVRRLEDQGTTQQPAPSPVEGARPEPVEGLPPIPISKRPKGRDRALERRRAQEGESPSLAELPARKLKVTASPRGEVESNWK